jgi:hypothetical protein
LDSPEPFNHGLQPETDCLIRVSGWHAPDDFKKIDRFFPGNAPQFDIHSGNPEAVDVTDIGFAQKNGGGAAQLALLVVDVADVQLIEKESETVGRPGIGDLAEQNDCPLTFAPVELVGLSKLSDTADDDLDPAGNRHPDHRFAKEIRDHMIVHNNDAGGPEKGNPGFQNLTVNQPVVYPHEGYVQ